MDAEADPHLITAFFRVVIESDEVSLEPPLLQNMYYNLYAVMYNYVLGTLYNIPRDNF